MQISSLIKITVLGIMITVLTGCASIVDGGPQKISVKSEPSDAKAAIFAKMAPLDPKGIEMSSQQTPAVFSLKRGAGYFTGANYRLVVEKPGYQASEIAIESKLDGWYFGNIFFGFIGFLAIDPATGAMWTLSPNDIDVALKQKLAVFKEKNTIVIMLRKDVPANLLAYLVPIPKP